MEGVEKEGSLVLPVGGIKVLALNEKEADHVCAPKEVQAPPPWSPRLPEAR